MSEHNLAGLAFAENLKRNPDLMDHITNPEALNKQLAATAKERAALNAQNAALKPSEPRKEYNQLRKELFAAQEWSKHTEVYCNSTAGAVRLLEQRITDLLKQKKDANPLAERSLENGIQLLETQLFDMKIELNRATLQSGRAGRGLKAFAGHERIAELKAELGIA